MLKVLLALLLALDAAGLLLLIVGAIAQIMSPGGINILLPGLGLVISFSLVLFVLFVIEIFLIIITAMLFRYIKNNSKLA